MRPLRGIGKRHNCGNAQVGNNCAVIACGYCGGGSANLYLEGRTFTMFYGRIYVLDNDIELLPNIMCPDSHHSPPRFPQSGEIATISFDSVTNLFLPEWREFLLPSFEIVAMPEVAINENTDPGTRNTMSGTTRQLLHMLAESSTLVGAEPTGPAFRLCIFSSHPVTCNNCVA